MIAPITFVAITPPGVRRPQQVDELECCHVERDAVRVEGVDHDHVVALVGPLEEAPAVVHLDLESRVARELEPPVCGLDDVRVELDGRDLDVAPVAPEPLLRRAPPRPTIRIFFAFGLYARPRWR